MRALRLCFIGPADNVTTRRWIEWFVARGHDATVLTVEPAETALLHGCRQIDLSMSLGCRKTGRLVSAVRMAWTLRRLKPDVVHVHYTRGLAWGMLLTRFHPYVVMPWGSDVLEEQGAFREWYSKRLTCAVLGRADLLAIPSEYLDRRVCALLPAAPPIARIGPGVNLRLFRSGLDVRPLRDRWALTESRRVIFSPRLAQPFYQHDRIIRALPAVREQVPEAVLVVTEQFADRNYVADLRRLAAALGVADHVRFVGAIPYPEMPLWYNLADAVVMVPRSDGLPNSLLEAMACGAVPILNALPQYAEMISHGKNGYLVDPERGDLVGALVRVLLDPGLRQRMGQANMVKATRVADQDIEMSRMEDWYFRLAGPDRHKAGAGERVGVV
ncbi:MAG: glycosyltransferase family 1 protein [Nitrospiraceae bacterium]|nr:MAG: glycosyltransferase family 1 protein [Nitrospiraceae bacterium]